MNANHLNITFMRHAYSRADDEGVHEGRYNSPLTDKGRAQARARAAGWQQAGVHFDQIVASPLVRAHETARIVAAALGAPISLDPDWMELDNGKLAGLTLEEARVRFPRPAFRSPYHPFGETGESEYGLHARASRALESLVRRGPGDYLVVAHGGSLNAALRVLMNVPIPVNHTGVWFRFGDTGYARFTYNPAEHSWFMLEFMWAE